MGLPSIQLIAKERVNQISDGYDAMHDDGHDEGELVTEAFGLALHALDKEVPDDCNDWNLIEKFGDDPIRALAVVGALISAELDRQLRIQAKQPKGEKKSKRKAKTKSRKND